MQRLPIVWQRLVSNGETCDRCAATQREIERALTVLQQALAPLGMEPELEIRELDDATFRSDLRGDPRATCREGRAARRRRAPRRSGGLTR